MTRVTTRPRVERGLAAPRGGARRRFAFPGRSRRFLAGVVPERWRLPLSLAVLAYAVVFIQRPGEIVTDSRTELSASAGAFLHRVSAVWSTTGDLGHIHSGQFSGYLFPQGPWFALVDQIGMPMWIGERLWFGTLLFLSGWGVVRVMDELFGRRRGVGHATAAVLYMLNPYVVTFGSRATVALLAYVTLPWLISTTHLGIRDPRGWRWPAVFALLVAASGGGVNAPLVIWVVAAPAGLVLYEVVVLRLPRTAVLGFAWRTAVCSAVASLWWVVPVAIGGRFGANFLTFVEQPVAVWATTSASESLRLLGYWIVYLGTGAHGGVESVVGATSSYLFTPGAVLATLLVPLAAFGGLRWTYRWPYAAYFGLLGALGLVVLAAGFPEAKPLARLLVWTYYHVPSLQFLKTTYKAAPLLALSLACLAGAAAAVLVSRAKWRRLTIGGAWIPAAWLLPLAFIPVLYGWPFFQRDAIDARFAYKVPAAWRAAVKDSERSTAADRRFMVLPGQLFASYRWGEVSDPIATMLTRRPVLGRTIVRYASERASQLQADVDDLLQQSRLVPGQLDPLLQLMGVGQVLVGTDGLPDITGEIDPASLERALHTQAGFARPTQDYGPARSYLPEQGRGGSAVRLPAVRRYAVSRASPGLVRLHPVAGATVLDGDSEGVEELAAHGALKPNRALVLAGDLTRPQLASQVRDGAALVLSDSNRRRYILSTGLVQNVGPTLGASDSIAPELPRYDLFPSRGTEAQTVAVYSGLRYLRSPVAQLSLRLFPQYRPYAAFDGRLDTPWIPQGDGNERFMDLALRTPRYVPAIAVHPHEDDLAHTTQIAISVDGGHARVANLHEGWNRVPIGRRVSSMRVRITGIAGLAPVPGGIDELRIPGLRVRETLRLPTELATTARGLDLTRNDVSVLLTRSTADFPYRAGADVGSAQSGNPFDMVDSEPGLERQLDLPAARTFSLDGWASVAPDAPDPALDRLTGMPSRWTFSSSSRFEGIPGNRASSAFDGHRATAWVGDQLESKTAWIQWTAPRPFLLQRFTLRRGRPEYAFPRRVRVLLDGVSAGTLPVAADGRVSLPRVHRASTVRLEVAATRPAIGPGFGRLLRAVSIAEVSVPGLDPPAARRTGSFATRCGELTVTAGGARATAAVRGSLASLDAGDPLRLTGCGPDARLSLPAGVVHLSAPPGHAMRADHLRLLSGAPAGATPAAAVPPASAVAGAGHGGETTRTGVRLDVRGPSWLVLAESYNPGWRAWCADARGHERWLGPPEAVDDYANGWRVGPGCKTARFEFAPQRVATASYLISGVGGILLLLVVAAGALRARRRRRRGLIDHVPPSAPELGRHSEAKVRLRLPGAVAAALLLGGTAGYVFAWRFGLALAVVTLPALLIGVTVRRLLLASTAGLVAVAAMYVGSPTHALGGYVTRYMTAHWITCGVVCTVAAACVMLAADLRRRTGATRVDWTGPAELLRRALGG